MSTVRRIVITVGAPLVVVAGLGVLWGIRNAAAMKAQIEAWADSLEHSPNPVTMRLSFIPMYVEGDKVGKLQSVVVQRDEPATVDSLRIEIALSEEADLEHLADCHFHLDPDAFDRELLGFKEVLLCRSDADDLVRFGSVVFTGTGRETGLYLAPHDLPCEHMSHDHAGPCTEISSEIRRLRTDVREGIRDIKLDIRGRRRTKVEIRR